MLGLEVSDASLDFWRLHDCADRAAPISEITLRSHDHAGHRLIPFPLVFNLDSLQVLLKVVLAHQLKESANTGNMLLPYRLDDLLIDLLLVANLPMNIFVVSGCHHVSGLLPLRGSVLVGSDLGRCRLELVGKKGFL